MDASLQLVILPSRPESGDTVSPELPLLGLPLIRRSVLSAARAGIEHVVVLTPEPVQMKQVLSETSTEVAFSDEPLTLSNPGRVLLLAPNVLPDSKWLKTLLAMPLEPDRIYSDAEGAAVIEVAEPLRISPLQSSCQSVDGLGVKFNRALKTKPLGADATGRFVLDSADEVHRAETWLLERLVKDSESFLCRRINRRISLAISRRFAPTSISPNAITLFSFGLGLLCAPFFLSSEATYQFIGAIIFLTHAIVDGCDGELARLRFQESRQGMILDFWGDNLVHAAVFSCIGIGWCLNSQSTWPLVVTAIAVAGTMWTAWIVYRQTLRWNRSSAPAFTSVVRSRTSTVSHIMDAMGNRDFIYLVLLLSAIGKAYWFLPLTAVGSPIYSLVLLHLARKD